MIYKAIAEHIQTMLYTRFEKEFQVTEARYPCCVRLQFSWQDGPSWKQFWDYMKAHIQECQIPHGVLITTRRTYSNEFVMRVEEKYAHMMGQIAPMYLHNYYLSQIGEDVLETVTFIFDQKSNRAKLVL